jgi:peptidoglycan hydrolase-like protein with peptidoglycan-binding domain
MKLVPILITAVALTATGTVAAQPSDAARSNDRSRTEEEASSNDRSTATDRASTERSATDTDSLRGRSSFARLTEEEIRQMQDLLKAQGYYEETVDGVAGPRTRSALRRFQRAQRLPVTGQLDRGTALALGMDASVAPVRGTRDENPPPRAEASEERMTGERGGEESDAYRAPTAAVIRDAQKKLESMGYRPGPPDGIAGPQTRDAVRAFQRANQLPVNGRLDEQTLERLGMGEEAERRQGDAEAE